MARAVHFRKESHTEFYKVFSRMCQTRSSWEVWADFVAMTALTIANAFDREGPTHDDREQEYIRTIKRCSKNEQEGFPKLFALTVEALEVEPDQDFLGEMFMGLNLGNHWKGQFFTPYSICRMMAEITITDLEARTEEKGWVGIHDPCCGAGALLIAARNTMVRQKLGPRNALYVAQDVDRTAALMCYIQLSLLGCAGYVVVADSLLNPVVGPGRNPLLISLAWEGKGEFCPNEEACRWCRAAPICRANRDYQLEIARHEFTDPALLTDEEVAEVLTRRAAFKAWVDSVHDYAEKSAINLGVHYPGFKLVEGKSNRKYTDEDAIAKVLRKAGYKVADIYKPRELLGLTAMEKMVGMKKFGELAGEYVIKPTGAPALVAESDRRPALNSPAKAAEDFDDDFKEEN